MSKLKLFISYCHRDEGEIIEFKKHIEPLKDNGLVEDWYDRNILPGRDYQDKIDNNLDDADIICLFLSANFYNSEACKTERDRAIELSHQKGIFVIPVILSKCAWLDDSSVSKLMALPADGLEVSAFPSSDEAYFQIYEGLKNHCEEEER
jgi:hypothetical protein